MKTILANKLFKDKKLLNSLEIECDNYMTVDFSHVEDFDIKKLNTLLNLQKIALFNDIKLDITNTTPNIDKILFETGIYKTFNNFTLNPTIATKRISYT